MMYTWDISLRGCKTLEDVRGFMQLHRVKIIFFAETHGILDELEIQDILLGVLKPTCYLYELLEEEKAITDSDFVAFSKKNGSERFSVISSFGELKPTIALAHKHRLPIIGCDIRNMCRKDKDFLKEINVEKEERIMLERERRQSKVIQESLNQYGDPIFVSVGAFHLRKDSFIFKEIKSPSIIVSPLIDGKELSDLGEDFNIERAQNVVYTLKFYDNGVQIKN